MGIKAVNQKKDRKAPYPFESVALIDLLGIRPIYLNKIIERNLYAIRPSIRGGRGKGQRRLFSADDVCGIALVWWLFENGLRSKVILKLLRTITKARKADAKAATKKLLQSKSQILCIHRELKLPNRNRKNVPRQTIAVIRESQIARLVNANQTASIQIIHVGNLFSDLIRAMKVLKTIERGE